MGGGLIQLVAYGSQDVFLTGNPQITFFKVVYRRHTNFSMEAVESSFNGTVDNSANNLDAVIYRNGDLISEMWLDINIPEGNIFKIDNSDTDTTNYIKYTPNTGHAYIDNVEIEIGGETIDKHYGHWLDVYQELTDKDQHENDFLNKPKTSTINYLLNKPNGELNTDGSDKAGNDNKHADTKLQLYVPLKFWFNRNPGLSLPIVALQHHEVKIKLRTRALRNLLVTGKTDWTWPTTTPSLIGNGKTNNTILAGADTTSKLNTKLFVNHIFLDTEERRRFAQLSHEYLIEQLQYQNTTYSSSVELVFNHPIKELIWTIQKNTVTQTDSTGLNTDIGLNTPVPGRYGAAEAAGGKKVAAAPIYSKFKADVSFSNKQDYFNYNCGETTNQESITNGYRENVHFDTLALKINGIDRFTAQKPSYFTRMQPYLCGHRVSGKPIYVYSFALKPEEHQPSGTCNFSRLDNSSLSITSPSNTSASGCDIINIYAINYNILRIMSGMAGLAYAN